MLTLHNIIPTILFVFVTDDDGCQEKLTWLKNSVEPWHMVEEYWMATNKIRLEPIKLGVEELTIEEYFRTYPALQQPTGYTLVSKYCYFQTFI